MGNDQGAKGAVILTAEELDAIGEIMNISMGASATAVSAMLDKQVTITTPQVVQAKFSDVDVTDLEPAIVVKIDYVEGLKGSNIIMLRRHDMQLILNLLMGNESDDDDFEFDDMSMSAACEVMNQMMGASSTALSEILSMTVNISTPTARLVDSSEDVSRLFDAISSDEQVVNVAFKMSIKGVMDSDFSCFLPTVLTRRIISFVSGDVEEEVPEPEAPVAPVPEPQSAPPIPEVQQPVAAPVIPEPVAQPPVMETPPQAVPVPPQAAPVPEVPPQGAYPQQQGQPQYMPGMMPPPYNPPALGQDGAQSPYMPPGYMPPYMTPQGYPYMPQYPYPYGMGYPQQQQPQTQPPTKQSAADRGKTPPVNIKKAQFPSFSDQVGTVQPLIGPNANLLMGVPLEVSIVIGKAKRKIRDILEFGPGTVVDLDKQTGAPAEIIVNGQLLAYGDVIVIGDNFGVRITEIVGTKDLLDSLDAGG